MLLMLGEISFEIAEQNEMNEFYNLAEENVARRALFASSSSTTKVQTERFDSWG